MFSFSNSSGGSSAEELPPNLATPTSSDLRLNLGSSADRKKRNVNQEDQKESFRISGNTDNLVVEAFGKQSEYKNVTKIIASADTQDDTILIDRNVNIASELDGGAGNDTLIGGSNVDKLYGGIGNDVLFGNAGNDFLFGNAGNDTLGGGDGIDILWGDNENEIATGGDDDLEGGKGNDTLYGGGGNDALLGGEDNDILYGNSGNDSLEGGAGNDDILVVQEQT